MTVEPYPFAKGMIRSFQLRQDRQGCPARLRSGTRATDAADVVNALIGFRIRWRPRGAIPCARSALSAARCVTGALAQAAALMAKRMRDRPGGDRLCRR